MRSEHVDDCNRDVVSFDILLISFDILLIVNWLIDD